MIKGENMCNPEEYAELIKRGSPDVIELKSYVWVGASQEHYKVPNMPYIDDMKQFMNQLLEHLPGYEYMREHRPSRAILLIKKSLNRKCWINYPKFFQLTESGQDYTKEDYSSKVMQPNS
tara:strand:- start:333 stop:692 length:360 start_codon:yes stop_codon:yes gene_type:complete